ncbi:MAG: tetratricopeptide repeat protein, partial [Xanthomonadales bacterium]|nr:tetratricopeptide repeat protein [Xanthomonadales bacterium]
TGELNEWMQAATSIPGQHLGRWLTTASFAANYFLGGLDPFGFKLANLIIHLINGILVFAVLCSLFRLIQPNSPTRSQPTLIAAAIACFWLVLPINLTPVLYSVQRYESLSLVAILLGLVWYCRIRMRVMQDQASVWRLGIPLLLLGAIGVTAKESALLLPVYAACLELSLWRSLDKSRRRHLLTLYGAILLAPALVATFWLWSWLGPETGSLRELSTFDRLITEGRVLVLYAQWTLVPNPSALSLYHDDFVASNGMLSPVSTLFSAIAILVAIAIAWRTREKQPTVSIGLLWFFCGHAMTATIVPLELVFEHRNYFSSIGLLLCVLPISIEALQRRLSTRAAAAVLVSIFVGYAAMTALRSFEWSDPIRHSTSEVIRKPESARARLEHARTLLIAAAGNPSTHLFEAAVENLTACMPLRRSGIACEAMLIMETGRVSKDLVASAWASLQRKLRERPPNDSDSSNLFSLLSCTAMPDCHADPENLGVALDLAADHPRPIAPFSFVMGEYAGLVRHDPSEARVWLYRSLEQDPKLHAARIRLIQLLAARGEMAEAAEQIQRLRETDRFGTYAEEIASIMGTSVSAGQVP